MNELLELLLGKIVQLHLKSERLLCNGLVRRVIVLFQIGMGEGIFHNNSLVRVERQHLFKEVEGLWICIGVELAPWDLWLVGQGLKVTSSLLIYDTVQIVRARTSQDSQDVVQLIKIMLSREDRSVREHLR